MAKNYSLSDDLGRDSASKSPVVGEHGWENSSPVMGQEEIVTAGSKNQQPAHSSKSTTNMAAPSTLANLDKHLSEFLKQGPILQNIQRDLKGLSHRIDRLERKRSATPIVERKKRKKQKISSSESDSASDILVSEEEIAPEPGCSTVNALNTLLSDGELSSDKEDSEDEFFKDLKSFFKDNEETGPEIDSDLGKIINNGLRSLGQTEEVKKLKEKYRRPSNVGNLQVPRVAPIIWRNLTDKGKAVDAGVQKTVAKFIPGITAVIQQFNLITKNKKEVKKNPLLTEMRKLTTDAVSSLSHAMASSNQLRKDAIKTELDSKFHSLCEPSHPVSEQQLFGEKLSSELKELDDTKKFHLSKRSHTFSYKQERRQKSKYHEDFRRGYGRNHRPNHWKKTGQQSGQKKDQKGKWSQKRQ